MSISSNLNLGLPAYPLADDPKLVSELAIVYNALHVLQQVLNDAGIPSGGSSPAPSALDVAHGGTGAATLTGIVQGSGTSAFTAVTSSTAGHILTVTGANAYVFAAPVAPTNVTVADAAGDTTCSVLLAGGAIGSQAVLSDAGITYNATTNALTATTFIGALTGTASGNLTVADIGVSVQAYDADLTTLGAGGAGARAFLGLVIGTDVQAYDADLTTWAGVTPGTGVTTALAVAVGTDGAFVVKGGALGTPSSGNLASCTAYPGTSALVTTGALNSGSITSGFGSIDIGTDTLAAGNTTITGTLTASTSISTGTGNTTDAGMKLINGTAGVGSSYGAIYPEYVTPSTSNYSFAVSSSGTLTLLNSTGNVYQAVSGTLVTIVPDTA
jgi:hypothetical protein